MAASPEDLLAMSDEDIGKMMSAPKLEELTSSADSGAQDEGEQAPPAQDPSEGEPAADPPGSNAEGEPKTEEPQVFVPGKSVEQKPGEEPKPKEAAAAASTAAAPKDGAAAPDAGAQPAAGEPALEITPEQAVDFYKQIMTPFKANGKTIELRTPEEARQLMQMGANYTKKLQALQPHRKMLMMLENNGLLDEGKLSFLIDIEKKNPEAIKKLLKDSGIDPLEIDTTTEPAYHGGNHHVADDEVGFRTVLDELSSNPDGARTIHEINTTWDKASKEVLWQSPDIMNVIHGQREAGVYDLIRTEVERQITLGHIPPNTPFIQAYKVVGDAMAEQARQAAGQGSQNGNAGQSGQAKAPQVLGTRVGSPKSSVSNGQAAAAASSTRTGAAKTPAPFINPLAEDDAAFLKRMENRL